MLWNYENLGRELDRTGIPGGVMLAVLDRPNLGLEHMLALLTSESPTVNQTCNALMVVHELIRRSRIRVEHDPCIVPLFQAKLAHPHLAVQEAAGRALVTLVAFRLRFMPHAIAPSHARALLHQIAERFPVGTPSVLSYLINDGLHQCDRIEQRMAHANAC